MDGVDLLIAAVAAVFGSGVLARVNVLSRRVDVAHRRIDVLRELVLRAHDDEEPPDADEE